MASENDGAEELIEFLADKGIKVLAGHTDYGYYKARDSFNNSVGAICHTFNACHPIEHHIEPGVVAAALTAKALGIKTIGLTGKTGGKLKEICDICVCVPETETFKVQELHLPVYHYLCAKVERGYCTRNS